MTNHCGECTLCCKVMGIQEIAKPAGKWCPNCSIGSGCIIYEDKPPSCTSFSCLWLESHRTSGGAFPLDLRPDKTHVVWHSGDDDGKVLSGMVDPDHPEAITADDTVHMASFFTGAVKYVIVGLPNAQEKILYTRIGPNAVGRKTVKMTPPDADGKQDLILPDGF